MAEVSADALRKKLGIDVTLEPGELGQFDVIVDDEVVASKEVRTKKLLFVRIAVPRFPKPEEVVDAVYARLPER